MKQWCSWLKDTKRAGHLTPSLSTELAEDRSWWGADYVLFMYTALGKREEQLKTAVSNIAAAFKTQIWDTRMWSATVVEATVMAGKRTITEMERRVVVKANNEKYDINIEFLLKLHDHLRPDLTNWDEDPDKEQVENALHFLLALLLLDMGMRVGMASPQSIGKERVPGTEESPVMVDTEVVIPPEPPSPRTDTEDSDAEDELAPPLVGEETDEIPAPEENAEERETRKSRSHEWKHENFRYACWDGEKLIFLKGGVEAHVFLLNNPNEGVAYVQVWFPTKKTSHSGRSGPEIPRWATLSRRSDLEIMALDLLLNFVRWNGPRDPGTTFLRRRAVRSSRTGRMGKNGKTIRAQDLITICKTLTEAAGVQKAHISAISFRKGHATLMLALCLQERMLEGRAMEEMKLRANKWSKKSSVPARHYLANWDDRGPLARIHSWEYGLTLGPGLEGWRLRQPPT